MPASVYCARPPVVFGISALSSAIVAIVIMLKMQAMIIATMNSSPMRPAPCPRETRLLVAMTSPTETATTSLRPNFFSSISVLPLQV